MPEKEVKLSGWLHLPDVSSRENLITYKRRRVTNKSPKPEESSETSMKWKIKKKGRDMGWAYGKMINGNRQHWQCNWCGLTRFGGGVTRLKRHIAGDMDVRQCPSAPAEVVKEVRYNLIMCDTKLKKKNKNKEVVVGPNCQENPEKVKPGKERIEEESIKNDEAKKEDLCNKDKLWDSWRGVLENMLTMPDGSGSGGVHTCIRNALSLNGPIQCKEVDTGILTKWGQALVDILNNDKFRLLCTLLCTNFGDGKNDSGCYFDFSQINTSMKKGDYDRSPELFHQDIQKIWEKFERIGHDMVDLATSLSVFSRAAIEKQISSTELDDSRKDSKVDPAMRETSNSADSNPPRKSTSSDANTTLDQVELEPSQNDACDYKCGTCSYCNLPIGEWEHISCTGCKLIYHLACVNPFTEDDTLNNTWYCSVCVSAKPIQSVTEVEHPVSTLDVSNSSEEPVGTGPLEACKICRGPKERGGVLLTCGRPACPHKYYHRKCLKKRQRPNATQTDKLCWYCPSCHCTTCLANKDDRLIVYCAGCDKAYHTYCMSPPLDSVPNGNWYCNSCHIEREREGMGEYERENEPENSEIYEPMKILICALESLEGQESLG